MLKSQPIHITPLHAKLLNPMGASLSKIFPGLGHAAVPLQLDIESSSKNGGAVDTETTAGIATPEGQSAMVFITMPG